MADRTLVVASAHGLHARPAALFVRSVTESGCAVQLRKGERSVNAASILGVVSLGIEHGDEVTLTVTGDDDERVLAELTSFLEQDHDA